MRRIVYKSRALIGEFTPEALDILRVALRKNAADGITGYLYRQRGHFYQCLEGPEAKVAALFDVIARDSRHCDVVLLSDTRIDSRRFPDWDMGYASNNDIDLPAEFHDLDTPNDRPDADAILHAMDQVCRLKADAAH